MPFREHFAWFLTVLYPSFIVSIRSNVIAVKFEWRIVESFLALTAFPNCPILTRSLRPSRARYVSTRSTMFPVVLSQAAAETSFRCPFVRQSEETTP